MSGIPMTHRLCNSDGVFDTEEEAQAKRDLIQDRIREQNIIDLLSARSNRFGNSGRGF
jgi:hypothetical protein